MFSHSLSIRKEISQTFCNNITLNDRREIQFPHTYLHKDILQEKILVYDWEIYIINLAEPFNIGHVEGNQFTIQWLCPLLDINIFLWIIILHNILSRFYSTKRSTTTIYLLKHQIDTTHSHFHPLPQTRYSKSVSISPSSMSSTSTITALENNNAKMDQISRENIIENTLSWRCVKS